MNWYQSHHLCHLNENIGIMNTETYYMFLKVRQNYIDGANFVWNDMYLAGEKWCLIEKLVEI